MSQIVTKTSQINQNEETIKESLHDTSLGCTLLSRDYSIRVRCTWSSSNTLSSSTPPSNRGGATMWRLARPSPFLLIKFESVHNILEQNSNQCIKVKQKPTFGCSSRRTISFLQVLELWPSWKQFWQVITHIFLSMFGLSGSFSNGSLLLTFLGLPGIFLICRGVTGKP